MTHGIPPKQEYARLGLGMFLCFSMPTFDGQEQGNANSSLSLINPTALSIDNWISAATALGAQYIVATVKHSDGATWWNTSTTTHNFTNAPFHAAWTAANGNLDMVAVFVNKCNAAGIKPCFYFSIADATFQKSAGKVSSQYIGYNSTQLAQLQADYSQASYLTYIQTQITELLTNYGPIYALWTDAGYWAMANTYYPWADYATMSSFIKGLQPNILIVNDSHNNNTTDSDIIVWESGGTAPGPAPGYAPQEYCDTLRADNTWFWHNTVGFKSTASIVQNIQRCSVANCSYLLDCTPDNTGLVPTDMMAALQQIGAAV